MREAVGARTLKVTTLGSIVALGELKEYISNYSLET
jgi:hypothetical protein